MTDTDRNWVVYCNDDGEPWAIFLDGHNHDLRTLGSLACKEEMRKAFVDMADALRKTLVLLEMGKLHHVPMGKGVASGRSFSGQFNMNQWAAENDYRLHRRNGSANRRVFI